MSHVGLWVYPISIRYCPTNDSGAKQLTATYRTFTEMLHKHDSSSVQANKIRTFGKVPVEVT